MKSSFRPLRKSFSDLSNFFLLCFGFLILIVQLEGCSHQQPYTNDKNALFRPDREYIEQLTPFCRGYLDSVVDRIIRYGVFGLPLRPRISIVKTQERLALSVPEYHIYISKGLIQNLQSEEQLAFVIAHELCHFKEGHFDHGLSRNKELEIAADTCAVTALTNSNYPVHAIFPVLYAVYPEEGHSSKEASMRLANLRVQVARNNQNTWSPGRSWLFSSFRRNLKQWQ
jgi:hypothetical protein